MIPLRVHSLERSKRIQHLQERLAFLNELPCVPNVTNLKFRIQNELEVLQAIDNEVINELSDL